MIENSRRNDDADNTSEDIAQLGYRAGVYVRVRRVERMTVREEHRAPEALLYLIAVLESKLADARTEGKGPRLDKAWT